MGTVRCGGGRGRERRGREGERERVSSHKNKTQNVRIDKPFKDLLQK